MAHRASDEFMMHAMTWATGVEDAASNDDPMGSDAGSAVETAEAFILSRLPRGAVEMIVQLEIICHDLDEGHRTDGLDILALRNVQQALLDDVRLSPGDAILSFLSARDAMSKLGVQSPSVAAPFAERRPQQLSGGGRCRA